nr:LysR substrate-binding domain-containing protein [Pseudomonas gingeri]
MTCDFHPPTALLRRDCRIRQLQRGGLSYLSAELCMRQGFFPQAARVVSRKTTQLQLIQAGFGIALLPESMRDIAPANIHFLPLKDPDCQSTLALACRQPPTPLVAQFVERFREDLHSS